MSDLIQFCIGIQFNQATEIISVKLCHLFTDLPDRTGEPLGKIDTEHNRYHCHKQINPDQHRKYPHRSLRHYTRRNDCEHRHFRAAFFVNGADTTAHSPAFCKDTACFLCADLIDFLFYRIRNLRPFRTPDSA